jgi:recombination protein RecR
MEIPSAYLQEAVNQFASLPGVGRKTALRLALFLLKQSNDEVKQFGQAFLHLKEHVQFCKQCHNISDDPLCSICNNPKRDQEQICVVEDLKDILASESTQQFTGTYHVLGGNISPLDGIGPTDLNIESLLERVNTSDVKEIILALSTTMEGDTTNFYLYKKLSSFDVKVTTLARGVAIGDELEYIDEVTLGRSLVNRLPYESSLKH